MPRAHIAFSLVELLVVITIVVVLLAMLAPSLDKAMYEAELATCASNLHVVGTGVIGYALEGQRRYPRHPATGTRSGFRPHIIADPNWDYRPAMRRALGGRLHVLRDPLVAQIDLDTEVPDNTIFASYPLWFGIAYGSEPGMFKMGDRLEFAGDRFDVLASDFDEITLQGNNSHGSHPDGKGLWALETYQDVPEAEVTVGADLPDAGNRVTQSVWSGRAQRGHTDLNFVHTDGSTNRLSGVAWNETDAPDSRLAKMPWRPNNPTDNFPGRWLHLARR